MAQFVLGVGDEALSRVIKRRPRLRLRRAFARAVALRPRTSRQWRVRPAESSNCTPLPGLDQPVRRRCCKGNSRVSARREKHRRGRRKLAAGPTPSRRLSIGQADRHEAGRAHGRGNRGHPKWRNGGMARLRPKAICCPAEDCFTVSRSRRGGPAPESDPVSGNDKHDSGEADADTQSREARNWLYFEEPSEQSNDAQERPDDYGAVCGRGVVEAQAKPGLVDSIADKSDEGERFEFFWWRFDSRL